MRAAAALLLLAAGAIGQEPDARLAEARDLQRRAGYAPALAFLEEDLSDERVAEAYLDVAIWAGQEERALARLRAAEAPLRLELILLWQLGRYGEAAARARAAGLEESAVWFDEQAARRERIAERTRRAGWVAALGALAIAGLAMLLFRLAPGPAARAGGRAG